MSCSAPSAAPTSTPSSTTCSPTTRTWARPSCRRWPCAARPPSSRPPLVSSDFFFPGLNQNERTPSTDHFIFAVDPTIMNARAPRTHTHKHNATLDDTRPCARGFFLPFCPRASREEIGERSGPPNQRTHEGKKTLDPKRRERVDDGDEVEEEEAKPARASARQAPLERERGGRRTDKRSARAAVLLLLPPPLSLSLSRVSLLAGLFFCERPFFARPPPSKVHMRKPPRARVVVVFCACVCCVCVELRFWSSSSLFVVVVVVVVALPSSGRGWGERHAPPPTSPVARRASTHRAKHTHSYPTPQKKPLP